MDQRERERQQAEELAAAQRQAHEEQVFNEQLQAHYEDRLSFYRQRMPGLPQEDFDRDLWPQLRAAYIAGEPDAVDWERRERSASVF